MLILLTWYKLYAVRIRHIISTSKEASKSLGFGTDGHYSEILSSGLIITFTYISSENG